MLRKIACLAFACNVACAAAEPDKATLIKELSDSYAKLEGFIATYRSEGKNKELDATISFDDASSQSTLELRIRNGGETLDLRSWYTDKDVLYIDSGHDRRAIHGIREELQFLSGFSKIGNELSAPLTDFDFAMTPNFMLTDDSLEAAIGTRKRGVPGWIPAIDKGKVTEVTDDTVVFSTEGHGSITISRESGIMLRQSFDTQDKAPRILELVELKTNPGHDAITSLSSDWSTLGATRVGVGTTSSELRLKAFQLVITAIENGDADLGKLETMLADQRDEIRRFADSCLDMSPGTFANDAKWKGLLKIARDACHQIWLKKVPGADALEEKDFKIFLMDPKVRDTIRDSIMGGMLDDPNLNQKGAAKIIPEIFGKGQKLTSSDESGLAALEMIESALLRSYLEAAFDRHMGESWGEREGLD